jgi:hypothetical protein
MRWDTALLSGRSAAVLLAFVAVSGCSLSMCGTATAAPVAQIVTPVNGAKLRKGQEVPISIVVRGSDRVFWRITLIGPGDSSSYLADDSGPVNETVVAQLVTASLRPGESYRLLLEVTDDGASATATAGFTVPDPQFALIPLEQGNLSKRGYSTYAVDGAGRQVLYSPTTAEPRTLTVIHRDSGKREVLFVEFTSNEGIKFSGDGRRLFYEGIFPQGRFGLGFLSLTSRSASLVAELTLFLYSVDHAGHRVAYVGALPGTDPTTYQYFLFNEETQDVRQLTEDTAAILLRRDCPAMLGTTPLITSDGSVVVLITPATLGIVPEDPTLGCRIFSYNVVGQMLKHVTGLPNTWRSLDLPVLSGDGRWLSFVVLQPRPTGGSRGVPVLLDMQTGDVSSPVLDVGHFTSFDAAVTRDGNGIIISTQADLDPRVGNADHNLELFYYDRRTGEVAQITETLAGIGRTPGGCPSYRPSVSDDGGVLALAFVRSSEEGCRLDGPQRNEADDFAFGFVRAVRKRPGNQEVVLAPVPEQRVVAGQTLSIDFSAHDADGDPISFFAQTKGGLDVPVGSTITDHYDGTARFEWQTRAEDAGTHVLRVAAFDEGGGTMFQDVTISIVPSAGNAACAGACSGEGSPSIDDLLMLVSIALGVSPLEQCAAGDTNGDGVISVEEILAAVANTLDGCPQAGS